jgi:hypothetical protein
MTDKQLVLETVQQLPDDAELEEISSEIEFLAAVRKGSKQIAEGKIVPHGTHRASRSSQPISADGPTSSEDCKSSNPGSDSRRLSDCLRDRREPRGSGNLQNLAFRQGSPKLR